MNLSIKAVISSFGLYDWEGIDWNGAGSASLECDVAKTVVVTGFSPPGLSLKGEAHGARHQTVGAYVEKLLNQGLLDPDLLARWLFIRFTEFSSIPIPSFQEHLPPILSRCVAASSFDYDDFMGP